MKYKAFLHFLKVGKSADEVSELSNALLPVAMIMVDGGTVRRIDFSSTDDISLISELEQARAHKNIMVYLSDTKNHRVTKAVMDLRTIKNNNYVVVIFLSIARYINGKMIEAIGLEAAATIGDAPRNALNNTVLVTFKLDETNIVMGEMELYGISNKRQL